MSYKLNLLPYNYTVKEPGRDRKVNDVIKPYDVQGGLVNIILNPCQGHGGFRQYTVGKVAKKIHDCKEDFILLDSTEYAVVKESFNTMKGYGPNERELLSRVYEAERV